MDPKWLLTLVLAVIAALGFCQVSRADQTQMRRLAAAGQQAYYVARYPQALDKWGQGLKLAQKSGDQPATADFLDKLGLVYDALGQYDRALEYHRQALAMHRDLKDRRGEAQDLNNLGIVYRHLNQYDQALEHHGQALNLFREIKDRPGEGSATGHLGLISWFMGQYDRSLEYNQAALVILREARDRRGEGQVLGNLGVEYYRLGQYDQAIEYHRQALAIHRDLKYRRFIGNELINLGEVYRDLGRYKEAVDCFRQALAFHRQTKSRRGEGQALTDLGLTHYDLGQYRQALKYHQQALVIHRETKNRLDQAADLTSLGLVYDNLEQPEEALKALQEAVKLCREVGQPENLWMAQRALGKVEAHQGRIDAAIQNYRQALDTIEGLRAGLGSKESKSTYMKNKLFVYDELIELLRARHRQDPARGYDRDALEIFERKQGRLFLEEMGESGARNFAGLPEEVKGRETELENRLDTLRAAVVKARSRPQPDQARLQTLEGELRQAREAFQTLKGEIRSQYPDYFALKYPQPAKLADLQARVLKPGEVMLVYGVLHDKTCLWVISKETFRLETLPVGEKDLGRKVSAYRRAVLQSGEECGRDASPDPVRSELVQLRHELHGLLLPDPVRAALAPGSLLYVIPTGPLYFLPFEALARQAPGQPSRYLVEDYAVAYLSSASLLKTLREAQSRKQTQAAYPLIAFANPSYGAGAGGPADDKSIRGLQTRAYREILGGTFPELPETEEEARAIKELLQAPEASRPLLVQDDASRSTVFSLNQDARLSAYRYLVFACHGILPGEVDRVVQPALVLAHPEKHGYLTMGDVFGLKLNADLVSLSACNTGRGARVKGEGVVGLTRSFMYAGTPAVAVTLWSVESTSAKELNVGMYHYLSRKHGRAAALREIKLAMLQGRKGAEYREPFFWAPLVVFGDGQ